MNIQAAAAFDQVDDLLVDIQGNSQAAETMPDISEVVDIMLGYIFCAVHDNCTGPGQIVDTRLHPVEAERIALAARINFCREEKARAAL